MPLAVAFFRVFECLPGPLVPKHHGAPAIFSLRNDAFEAPVFERMIFDLHRQPFLGRVEVRPLGNGPAFQHTIQFQTKVVVQMRSCVLLNDELEPVMAHRLPSSRLAGFREISFLTIFPKSHICCHFRAGI